MRKHNGVFALVSASLVEFVKGTGSQVEVISIEPIMGHKQQSFCWGFVKAQVLEAKGTVYSWLSCV